MVPPSDDPLIADARAKNERRRRLLALNNLYAGLGYVIPLLTILIARACELASFSWGQLGLLALLVTSAVGLFAVLIQVKKALTPAFCKGLYISQFIAWLLLYGYMVSFLDEVRVAALFFAFISLVFLMSAAEFRFSIGLTIAVVLSYGGVAYLSIANGQSGTMARELFNLGVFFPVALFIALMARVFRSQRRQVFKAKRELEEANRKLQEKNATLEGLSAKLAKYLSPQVYDSIFTGRQDVTLQTSRKKLSIFFSDIKGFTQLTDSMEPEAMATLLNHYLNEMAEIALRFGGTIDKFIGDAIMIFFGDPESRGLKEDALACVSMAIAMRQRVRELQREWLKQGVARPMQVRMGVASGYCTVGNFGSENRLDYTIIGGQVNLASRLESACEPDQILISHETYALVSDEIYCEPKGQITVKGIAHPVETYQAVLPYKDIDECHLTIRSQGSGYNLDVDFLKITEADRARLRASLEELLIRLDGAPQRIDESAKEWKTRPGLATPADDPK